MGLLGDAYDTVAGVADHAAGSVDESIGRQFDDQAGGGFADETANAYWSGASDGVDLAAGLGDWLAGDVDETIGRSTRPARQAASLLSSPMMLAGIVAVVLVALAFVGDGS